MQRLLKYTTAGLAIMANLLFFSCNSKQSTKTTNTKTSNTKKAIATPVFNGDSAYQYVANQVNFGPRVPNTDEHAACATYLADELKRFGADVIVQEADVVAFDNTVLKAKNIIGQFNPEQNNRLLLFAHWDTRPFADYDKDPAIRNKPIDGANDGGSGVGVLLEIARQIGKSGHPLGIDIIFFDAEDYGQPAHINLPQKDHTWCLGSQYWGQNPHRDNYTARYGILLDMVGAPNALFYQERYSIQFAPDLVKKVWNKAYDLGYGNHFPFELGGMITDDHVYVNGLRNIPCIDIIQYDPSSEQSFGSYWHTHDDTMEFIDKNTLKAVGQTVLEVIYSEN
ncbi:M28 family peptidase [Carboxylicivirga sp. M1479]|uniref:M28 family peptidase n=1 Tax=Carboxylicivirga sp. M1479 TaxID=2594476 RepID=UPI0011775A32|nr:M28 family peptidase [Carboxylicivirga sp. M1479]TRX62358.1 M28 family peptidase [Carboxylicivirga sp. M1479]